ncbi:hypothetical protein [Algiphilus sp.]|uniref:hypothetical protein n=1 Tax=Algiphilus sp. TaxID=1872431 RepID=UPI0025C591D8|nr:hypothetical protein [Algiphilus sp.]MCK5771538.1 hypothetical protein [Algiphilus sp.]
MLSGRPAVAPVLPRAGVNLLTGIDLRTLGYRCVQRAATDAVAHIVLARPAARS